MFLINKYAREEWTFPWGSSIDVVGNLRVQREHLIGGPVPSVNHVVLCVSFLGEKIHQIWCPTLLFCIYHLLLDWRKTKRLSLQSYINVLIKSIGNYTLNNNWLLASCNKANAVVVGHCELTQSHQMVSSSRSCNTFNCCKQGEEIRLV